MWRDPSPVVDPPTRVVGVDFSGARDARENVWIAECERTGEGLALVACGPASERLAPDGPDPGATRDALVGFVDGLDAGAAVGLDVPFSLPAPVARGLGATTWRETLDAVAAFDDASAMDAACQAATPGERTYARRTCDDALDSFSPYHFFVKRQTYHGMTLLRSLVDDGSAWVLPFDLADARAAGADARPLLLETYPAGVFERLGLCRERYKGPSDEERRRRERNLAGLREHVAVPDPLADRIAGDADGDALDALAAAVGTRLAVGRGLVPRTDEWALEGAIYPLPDGSDA